ncbi:MAG: hypothetical protein K0R88_491 [Solirubrobacterales bacterium]|jgi:hypothetical protein|nr:hypothetical protein [Solirubrobacterales bacterium]
MSEEIGPVQYLIVAFAAMDENGEVGALELLGI